MSDQVIERIAEAVMTTKVPEKILTPVEPGATPEAKVEDLDTIDSAQPIYEPSQGAALLQDLIQRIDVRARDRADLLADLRQMEVAAERLDREEKKDLDAELEAAHREYVSMKTRLETHFREMVEGRKESIASQRQAIATLDKSLEQMRKQANAEIAKLAPDRKVQA